jgi:nucleoside phosphorylase
MPEELPLVSEQELIAHVFVPVEGPLSTAAGEWIRELWSLCGSDLGMTESVPRLDLPRTLPGDFTAVPRRGPVAALQSQDTCFQAIVRREHDVLNVSLLLAPPDGPDGPGSPASSRSWLRENELLNSVLSSPAGPLLGAARLYLGKHAGSAGADGQESAPALPVSAPLGSALAGLLPDTPQDAQWWQRGVTGPAGLTIWEITPREDTRLDRRIVLLAPADADRELSAWAWTRGGDPAMPSLARYLMHMAKIRYELRVHAAAPPVAARCQRAADGISALRSLLDGSVLDGSVLDGRGPSQNRYAITDRLAELDADSARMAETSAALMAMRRTVQIAEQNAAAALGLPDREPAQAAGGTDLFADDRAMASWFGLQLEDDIAYLDASLHGAKEMNAIAARAVPLPPAGPPAGRGPSSDPVFGIVTALPEEFAAMRALTDAAERKAVAGDRADYILGTLPGLDADRPHRVVLTMLGETGNDAAAEACTNLARSFGSVSCILMVGIAAGIPAPRRPEQHVRLGDVVVATWGILDYDHVIDRPDGAVPRQPFPRPSPLLVRRAKLLEADDKAGIRPWEQWLERGERDLPDFVRPPADSDVLYASDRARRPTPHPGMALSRHRAGWPKVHYGLIGSADRSLRSASSRDQLAASHPGLRAIEMEGKGIGNAGFSGGLEWFVVRGISDYGDRRTGTQWRNYASLAAAAYTRALLAECAPVTSRGGYSGATPGT